MTDKPNHHHAAELNLQQLSEYVLSLASEAMTTDRARAIFAERTAIATVANTQALLAINETLMAILDRMPTRETP